MAMSMYPNIVVINGEQVVYTLPSVALEHLMDGWMVVVQHANFAIKKHTTSIT